jgi:methylated-DNA-protein-cysteine methyltransferase-like protein
MNSGIMPVEKVPVGRGSGPMSARSRKSPAQIESVSNYDKIYAVVETIPHGRVATYGQVAALAGLAGHARQVGYALFQTPTGSELPWHRVINSRGEISKRSESVGSEQLQRLLLEEEGVEFNDAGRVELKRFRWQE